MRFSRDWHFYGMCALAAVMSAAGVVVLDEQGIIRIGAAPETGPALAVQQTPLPALADVLQKRQDRLMSTPPLPETQFETVTITEPPAEAPLAAISAANPADSENPDWWPADVQRESRTPSAGPRVAPAPPIVRLPWQSPPKPPLLQTARLTQRLAEISPTAKQRLTEKFAGAKAVWPPAEIALVAIKDEKILELVARSNGGAWTIVHRYPVLAASGAKGPKLRKGDQQVPEGVYGISFLNPDSRYHVSLRVNYPNSFDRQMAEIDGRSDLGGDIMIHGKNVSTGCLAVGDAAAEELFVLAASIGVTNIKVVIAPTEMRGKSPPSLEPGQPQWVPKLYTEVASAMAEFPKPPSSGLLSFFGK